MAEAAAAQDVAVHSLAVAMGAMAVAPPAPPSPPGTDTPPPGLLSLLPQEILELVASKVGCGLRGGIAGKIGIYALKQCF